MRFSVRKNKGSVSIMMSWDKNAVDLVDNRK